MTKLAWDQVGSRLYETGVDHGVLYIPDGSGAYALGVAWNGLTTVTESPTGAEATALYADNIKYLNLISAETFEATIEAYTAPPEWAQFDGISSPTPGVYVGQQSRKLFGMSYRTRLGNDVSGADYAYKLHLIYGATAAPSEKAYGTINDTPEAITFSWQLTTTPVDAGNTLKPTSQLTIDSSKVDPTALSTLEDILYGTGGSDPRLPLPVEVMALFAGSVTIVNLAPQASQPSYVAATHIITLPSVTGVQWKINGVNKAPGAQPALTVGQTAVITAVPASNSYVLSGGDDDWTYNY